MTSIESSLHISPEFARAFDLLENSKQNVFLTGRAGTGKSTFLQYLREHSKKKIVVVAPTGVAALNVAGQTIHSFFRFPPRFLDVSDPKLIRRQRGSKIYSMMDLLIVDEISMVRADVFQSMDLFLRLNGRDRNQPFGGIQICVVGDMHQLPPVVGRDEESLFHERYETPFFFSAPAYKDAEFETIEFQEIYRQENGEFIELLNRIREGEASEEVITRINQRVIARAKAMPGTLTLTARNLTADRINETELGKLTNEEFSYNASMQGEFGLSGDRLPAPEKLRLKVGAQVMFTRNDKESKCWVNGTLGIVHALTATKIQVKVNDAIHTLTPEKWEMIRYEADETGAIIAKAVGTYKQYPLTPAWAVTIHKAQGKTLNRVIIDLDNGGAFAAGQLYVALSRCRSLENIALRKPATARDIRCDERVIEFSQTAQG